MKQKFVVPLAIGLLTLSAKASMTIKNGVELQDGQLPQVQSLIYGENHHCTATLVGPNVIISAAHCTTGQLTFGTPDSKIRIVKYITHPKYRGDKTNAPEGLEFPYDVGIGILEESITSIVPISISSHLPDVRDEVLFLGAGNPTPEVRKYGTSPVLKVSTQGVTLRSDGDKAQFTCNGDSGGPNLHKDSNGNVTLFGVNSTSTLDNDYTNEFGELGRPHTSGTYSVYPSNRQDHFLKDVAKEHGLAICGINKVCPQVKF